MAKPESVSVGLTFSEQFFLLSIDPVTGRQFPVSEQILNITVAGSLLLDASFSGLINDDWEKLIVLKSAGSGNPVLDEALLCFRVLRSPVQLDQALSLVAAHGKTLRKMILDRLQNAGLLCDRKKETAIFSKNRSVLKPDLPVVIEVHQKIRNTIISEEIPDVSTPALISLMVAGGLIKYILKPEEMARFTGRIEWLAHIESLGREIIRATRALATADLEQYAAVLAGFRDVPKTYAGGMDAVLSSLSYIYKEAGLQRGGKAIARFNQVGGFECPGCAWPNPDDDRSHFEFCENGAKNVSAEATTQQINRKFFERWAVKDLLLTSGYWLEQQGRLAEPMLLEPDATHYQPIAWEQAFALIADELKKLNHPDEAVFYASGRTSIEAAFLYQLFARAFGTNNLPNSANVCHEPSGKALAQSLGYGKSSVTLSDFEKADAIFHFGHNPGSNHARMLKSMQRAARNGCRIVAVNPMPEASMLGFSDPQEVQAYLAKPTPLARLFLQPVINGDMALVRGVVKAVLETEEQSGDILDHDFIQTATSGFQEYKALVMNTSWDDLVAGSGVEKSQILEAAAIYCNSRNVIACWCLGITHHRNAVETIREIVNLLLLRGNIGRPGTGVCPVRGHSNIQGIRTAGIGENMPVSFFESMERYFGQPFPKTPGKGVIPAIRSMAAGEVKALISLGGNLAAASPDTTFTEAAIQRCSLTVMISTKLNRSHLITGKRALILPCLSRSDRDVTDGVKQIVSIEDAMGKVGFSTGCLTPISPEIRSEISIIAGMAAATLGDKSAIDWHGFSRDYRLIRSAIGQVVPVLGDLPANALAQRSFYLDNPLKQGIFKTSDQKAHFSQHPLESEVAANGELLMMTIRSHDQFNTSIFGLNDRYRGISNERRILFMNETDMKERAITPGKPLMISSDYDGRQRRLEGYFAVPYPIHRGCVAAYFPEINDLISIHNTCGNGCETPAYKSVRVRVI